MTKTILVDGNNLSIAAHFGIKEELRDMDGRPVAAIFGFIRSLRAVIEMVQLESPLDPVKTLVLWDDAKHRVWRRLVLDTYKESRDTAKADRTPEQQQKWEDYFMQLGRIHETLTHLGVGQLRALGFEADDLAGWLVKNPGEFVLVSGDRDWWQLVSERARVWRQNVPNPHFITLENFEEKSANGGKVGALDTEMYVQAMAIAGDDGDDVPGIPGVGKGYAYKYLRGALTKGKRFDQIEAWKKDPLGYARSLQLVDLRNIEIPLELVTMTPGKLDQEAFMNICIHHGFESMLRDLPGFTAPFLG